MEENSLLISVIIPMYNSAETIIKALDSVKAQTFKCYYDVIVVNDGSMDKSQELVENYIFEDNRFKLILINQENGGVSTARNAGLKASNGDLIAFLDSDDQWFPDKLEKQTKLLELNPQIDLLGCAFDGLYLPNTPDGSLLKIDISKLIFKNYFQPSTVIMKRKVFEEIGYFDENQKYAEEGNYFFRISRKFQCYFLNKELIIFGDGKSGFGESGLSANLKEMEKGELKNLKFAYENKWIGFGLYFVTVCFSLLKYLRRIVIVKLR